LHVFRCVVGKKATAQFEAAAFVRMPQQQQQQIYVRNSLVDDATAKRMRCCSGTRTMSFT
jgi:hypothetical protein